MSADTGAFLRARCEDFGNAYYLDLHTREGEVYEIAFTPDEWRDFLTQAAMWQSMLPGTKRRWRPWR